MGAAATPFFLPFVVAIAVEGCELAVMFCVATAAALRLRGALELEVAETVEVPLTGVSLLLSLRACHPFVVAVVRFVVAAAVVEAAVGKSWAEKSFSSSSDSESSR